MTENEIRDALDRMDKATYKERINKKFMEVDDQSLLTGESRDDNALTDKALDERKEKREFAGFITPNPISADRDSSIVLRLEAMRLAIQAGYVTFSSMEQVADKIYNWINKPE